MIGGMSPLPGRHGGPLFSLLCTGYCVRQEEDRHKNPHTTQSSVQPLTPLTNSMHGVSALTCACMKYTYIRVRMPCTTIPDGKKTGAGGMGTRARPPSNPDENKQITGEGGGLGKYIYRKGIYRILLRSVHPSIS